mgnify:CR=1 FL=1
MPVMVAPPGSTLPGPQTSLASTPRGLKFGCYKRHLGTRLADQLTTRTSVVSAHEIANDDASEVTGESRRFARKEFGNDTRHLSLEGTGFPTVEAKSGPDQRGMRASAW